MTTEAGFAKNFPDAKIPVELAKLLAFQESGPGFEGYCDGFGLCQDDKGLFRTWSEDGAFLDALIPIGQATGGGSVYALWSDGTTTELSAMPVVVYGDEGGSHVVAENLKRFLQLLTFDVEPMVDFDSVTYYKGSDHKPRRGHAEYVAWLRNTFDLAPIDDAKALVAEAQAKHGAAFAAWQRKFVAD